MAKRTVAKRKDRSSCQQGSRVEVRRFPIATRGQKGSPILSYAQACKLQSAETFGEPLKKPAILSLADLRRGLEPLRDIRYVNVQFCGDDDKCIQFATAGRFRDALRVICDYPEKASAYLVTRTKRAACDAWPIVWQGAVGPTYLLVAYVDPVRYGFKSHAESFLTIGPPAPMPIDERRTGFLMRYDFVKRNVVFEPIVGED